MSAHQFAFTPGRQAEEVLFAIREVFQGNCHQKALGYRDHDLWLPVLAFADKIWLFARPPKELERMFRGWTTALHEHGLRGEIITTTGDDKAKQNNRPKKAWRCFYTHK